MPEGEFRQTMNNGGFMAALYQQADDDGKQLIRSAVERAGNIEPFQQALQDPDQLAFGAKMAQNNPQFVQDFLGEVQQFASTQSPAGVFKVDRRGPQGKPASTPAEDFDEIAASEGFTQKTKPQQQVEQTDQDATSTETKVVEEAGRPVVENRNELIAKFNDIGNQIFDGDMSATKEARFDWAMKQLVASGFDAQEARSVLSGNLQPEKVEAPADQTAVTELGDQGALDEATATANAQQLPGATEAVQDGQNPTADQVSRAIEAGNEIGRGGNAIVFDLPGTPFVVRVPKGRAAPSANDSVVPASDPFEGRNFGQPLFTIGDVQVLRRQDGVPAGLTNHRGLTQEKADAAYADSIKAAARMPQSAYDKFAEDLKYLNQKGASFDPSKSNNVLIDSKGGAFNLVDINQQKSADYNNSFGDMVVTLMGNTYAYRYKGEQSLGSGYATIYLKALKAAKKAGLGIDIENDSSVQYSRKLAGIGGQQEASTGAAAKPDSEASASQQANQKLKDALADLGDVLGDAFGAKMNIAPLA